MPDERDDRLDRYAAGELSLREQRDLAQAALDDPALFETLTATALLRESVRADDPLAVPPRVARRRRPMPLLAVVGGAMAAAAAFGVVVIWRSSAVLPSRHTVSDARTAQPVPQRAPTEPAFLIVRVDPDPSRSEFRSVEAGTRLPRDNGVVAARQGDEIEINLGSIDGLAKGSTLSLIRKDGGELSATLTVETVFRDRARGRARPAANARPGDRVEVSRADAVRALLEHADARVAGGDLSAARRLAELAVRRAEAVGAPDGLKRRPLVELGSLEHRIGAIDAAERHLRRAVQTIDEPPVATAIERAQVLSALAAVLIGKRAYGEAEPLLRSARPYATGHVAVRIANDLGALAAIRGDRSAAALYQSALESAGNSLDFEGERRTIEANLELLRTSR